MASCVLVFVRGLACPSGEAKHEEGLVSRDLYGVEIGLESCQGDDRCNETKRKKTEKEKERAEAVLGGIGKTKGRWINPVMACDRE